MRKALFLLGPLVGSLVVFACDDSGDGDFSTGSFEAGSGFEAGPTADSAMPPTGDSATDADADASPALVGVTVSLLRGTTLVPNIDVVFHDASGAELETMKTGANGKATSTMAGVAQASVLFGTTDQRHIVTWTSVADADSLVAFDDTTDDPAGTIVATTATLRGATSLSALVGECSGFSTASPTSIAIERSCVRAKEAVLVSATDVNGNLLDYAFAKAQAGPPADAGAAATTLGAWVAPSTISFTAQGVPESYMELSLDEIANELPFENDTVITGELVTDPSTFKVAPAFADAYQFGVRVPSSTVDGASHSFGARVAPAAATTLAYASTMPALNGVTVDRTNAARPQVAWTTVGNVSLATADGGVVVLAWQDATEHSGTWSFVVAPGSKGVTAPAMPTTLASFPPAATDEPQPPSVTFAESDLIADYTAFRAAIGLAFHLDSRPNTAPRPLLPATGKYELTSYQLLPR